MAFVAPTPVARPSLLTRSSLVGARVSHTAVPRSVNVPTMQVLPVFTKAMEDYKTEYPQFAERGWGATVKAERWNGRHAMFGLLMLVATGYAKGHGLFPDTPPVDLAQFGVLTQLGDTQSISFERCVILVAHIHVLFVSVAAALAPFSFQDKLLLEPGEEDEEPAGLFPPFELGLTKSAELWNSRVAMLGVISIVACSVATKTSVLDTINLWLGGLLF
eukprot:GFKZ01014686.1.p1 GENE.GFKZ01014686.1~~GFKZ01014686.1.p1  ORF type:complete len:218 (+),score=26.91 GFKZ01014686.1:199-852(+)